MNKTLVWGVKVPISYVVLDNSKYRGIHNAFLTRTIILNEIDQQFTKSIQVHLFMHIGEVWPLINIIKESSQVRVGSSPKRLSSQDVSY